MRKLRGQAHWLCQSPGGLPPLRQARPAPAQRNQASESILDEERGRHGPPAIEGGGSAASIEGADAPYGRKVRQPLKGCALTKIGFANASIPSLFPTKKRTSYGRFVNTSRVRSEKPRVPDLAQ